MKYKNHADYTNPVKFCGECNILPRYLSSPAGVRLWCGREDSDEGCHRVTIKFSPDDLSKAREEVVNYWNDRQTATHNRLTEFHARRE